MQTCLKSSWSQLLLCIRFSTYLHFREFIVLSSGSASNSDESSSTREVSAIWDAVLFFLSILSSTLIYHLSSMLFYHNPFSGSQQRKSVQEGEKREGEWEGERRRKRKAKCKGEDERRKKSFQGKRGWETEDRGGREGAEQVGMDNTQVLVCTNCCFIFIGRKFNATLLILYTSQQQYRCKWVSCLLF